MKTKTFKHRLLAVGASMALGLVLSAGVQAKTLVIDDFNTGTPRNCIDGSPDSNGVVCGDTSVNPVDGTNNVMMYAKDINPLTPAIRSGWERSLSADLDRGDDVQSVVCDNCQAGHHDAGTGGAIGVTDFTYKGSAIDLTGAKQIDFDYAADLTGGIVQVTFSDGASSVTVDSGALQNTNNNEDITDSANRTPVSIPLPTDPVFTGVVSITIEIIGVPNLQLTIDDIQIPNGKPGDFLCYKSFGSFLRQEVNLVDQFDDVNFDVLKPKMFCNPAIKPVRHPDVGMENPDAHLLSYKINEAHREPRHERQTVVMQDQFFSALTIQTIRPDRLMVPSGKSLDGTVPTDQTGAINHFKCYRVRPLNGFQEVSVNIADQFTDPDLDLTDPLAEPLGKDLVLVRPTRMCTPVSKNDEGIIVDPDANPNDPRDHLMCYRVKADRGVRLNRRTEITSNNQFGDEDLVLKRELEFCAPATKTVVTVTGG